MHKETGELVYHTRKTERPDEVFSRVFKTVWQHHREPRTSARTGDEAAELSQSIAELQSLVAKHPEAAKPLLALAMAWFAIGKADAARRQLDRATELDPTNTIILREDLMSPQPTACRSTGMIAQAAPARILACGGTIEGSRAAEHAQIL